jgi:FtsP/CotA-like multicopper oxidase with cupredoxin domain
MWTVNGQIYDGSRPNAVVGKDTAEIWVLQGGGSWVHPIHHHYEEHRTLFRSGIKPRPQHLDYGRDDTMNLGAGERGIMFRRFRNFTGKYVMHCHNVVHEDHAMMIRFDVV